MRVTNIAKEMAVLCREEIGVSQAKTIAKLFAKSPEQNRPVITAFVESAFENGMIREVDAAKTLSPIFAEMKDLDATSGGVAEKALTEDISSVPPVFSLLESRISANEQVTPDEATILARARSYQVATVAEALGVAKDPEAPLAARRAAVDFMGRRPSTESVDALIALVADGISRWGDAFYHAVSDLNTIYNGNGVRTMHDAINRSIIPGLASQDSSLRDLSRRALASLPGGPSRVAGLTGELTALMPRIVRHIIEQAPEDVTSEVLDVLWRGVLKHYRFDATSQTNDQGWYSDRLQLQSVDWAQPLRSILWHFAGVKEDGLLKDPVASPASTAARLPLSRPSASASAVAKT